MGMAEVREMSASLIGTEGSRSAACQAMIINYWHMGGKELGMEQASLEAL